MHANRFKERFADKYWRNNRSKNKVIGALVRTLALSFCLSLSACVVVNSSSISEKTGAGSPINAEYSDYGILHLTAPSTLTANANGALAGQCQSGMLSNVQTELSTRDWFFIVQYYTVTVSAYCK
jgi:hypothetical protein